MQIFLQLLKEFCKYLYEVIPILSITLRIFIVYLSIKYTAIKAANLLASLPCILPTISCNNRKIIFSHKVVSIKQQQSCLVRYVCHFSWVYLTKFQTTTTTSDRCTRLDLYALNTQRERELYIK